MANFDAADLLARVQRDSGVPSTTAFPGSADWYAWLTDAEMYWKPLIAAEYPYFMMNAPTLMTTVDGGITYQFPGGETLPLAVSIYPSITGDEMKAGQFDDVEADFVWEGSQIRMPVNQVRGFSDGAPYARWVSAPGTINGTTNSTMLPLYTRQLLVDRALIYWSERGGMRDPKPWYARESARWAKIEESLKNLLPKYGDAASRRTSRVWGIDYLVARARG